MVQTVDLEDQALDAAQERVIDILARTIWAEARNQGEAGMRAAGHVIDNRAAIQSLYNERGQSGYRWGNTIEEVAQRSSLVRIGKDDSGDPLFRRIYQFTCWDPSDPNYSRLLNVTDSNPEFAKALEIAREIVNGTSLDPTFGADHYYNPDDASPGWRTAGYETITIGNHEFRNLSGMSSGRLWAGMSADPPIPMDRPNFRNPLLTRENVTIMLASERGQTALDALEKFTGWSPALDPINVSDMALAYADGLPRLESVEYNEAGLSVIPEAEEFQTAELVAPIPRPPIQRETSVDTPEATPTETQTYTDVEFAENFAEMTFRRGDSVGKLALEHGVARADLAKFFEEFERANDIPDAARVFAGQEYKMPLVLGFNGAAAEPETPTTEQPANESTSELTVRTVTTIAIGPDGLPIQPESVPEIVQPNPIEQGIDAVSGAVKSIFDALGLNKDEGIVIVERGDTLARLMGEHFPDIRGNALNERMREIGEHNDISNINRIYVGQKIDLTP